MSVCLDPLVLSFELPPLKQQTEVLRRELIHLRLPRDLRNLLANPVPYVRTLDRRNGLEQLLVCGDRNRIARETGDVQHR